MKESRISLWVKLPYTLLVCIVVPVYWHELGPSNFLWFSDIALIVMVPALWLESRFLASTMAVGVLGLELSWVLDFLAGGNLTQIAAYMYSDETQWHIRLLSGTFHLALPPVLILSLIRLGYDRRALPAQALLALVVLPLTRWLTEPVDNINWVYGPVDEQTVIPAPLYLCALYLTFLFVVYLPSHWVLKRWFSR